MAEIISRFKFPGFAVQAIQDTSTHEVEVGEIQDGRAVVTLHLLRSKQAPNLNFIIPQIDDDRWSGAFRGKRRSPTTR